MQYRVFCVVMLIAPAAALADPVRFDNYDQAFVWDHSYLDIRMAPDDQTGIKTVETFSNGDGYDNPTTPHVFAGWVSVGGDYVEVYSGEDILARPVDAGFVVHDDLDWFGTNYQNYSAYSNVDPHTHELEDYITNLPYGEPAFLAVKVEVEETDDTEFFVFYGWIEVLLEGEGDYILDALSWGYETTPWAPIEVGAIPEPASLLALLALGFVAARRREPPGV